MGDNNTQMALMCNLVNFAALAFLTETLEHILEMNWPGTGVHGAPKSES